MADHDTLPDLATEADVCTLVRAFYTGIDEDPVLGPFFAHVDAEAHQARMVVFWSAVVFQTGAYRGRPLEAHARLAGLHPAAFEAWLSRFRGVVQTHFEGDRADAIQQRAEQIAAVFQIKLGLLPSAGASPRVPLIIASPCSDSR